MIFVTGGTGVLGSQLLFDLTQKDTAIRALYRSESKRKELQLFFKEFNPDGWKSQFDKIEWVEGDILDIPCLMEQMEGCTHVYHCAALVSFHNADFNELVKINRVGTTNIVNVALSKEVKKLCYVSSTAAIGVSEKGLISEETKWKNTPTTTGYSLSKYSAEKEVWRGIEEGLDAVIVNPCVILGAGNWNESSLTIFQTLQNGLRHYPPGSNSTVDARDVSRIMIRLMDSHISKERYLCIGSNQSFKELMEEIALQLKVKPPTKLAKRWMVNIARRFAVVKSWFTRKRPALTSQTIDSLFSHRAYDNSKVKKELNENFYSLKEMVGHAIKHRIH